MTTLDKETVKRHDRHRDDSARIHRLAEALVDRMGVEWSANEHHELVVFLFNRLWWEWPASTWRGAEAAIEAALESAAATS